MLPIKQFVPLSNIASRVSRFCIHQRITVKWWQPWGYMHNHATFFSFLVWLSPFAFFMRIIHFCPFDTFSFAFLLTLLILEYYFLILLAFTRICMSVPVCRFVDRDMGLCTRVLWLFTDMFIYMQIYISVFFVWGCKGVCLRACLRACIF